MAGSVSNSDSSRLDEAARLRLQLQLYVHWTLAQTFAAMEQYQRDAACVLQTRLGETRTIG